MHDKTSSFDALLEYASIRNELKNSLLKNNYDRSSHEHANKSEKGAT